MTVDRSAVLTRRMVTQRMVGRPLPSAVDAVELLTCVQAQEFGHATWSLGMRSADRAAEIAAAFDAGDLLRTHILRPTWHLVTPADLDWILAATSQRVHLRNAGMYRQTGVDADTVARTGNLLTEMLAGNRSLTRPEIGEQLAAGGIERPTGMRLTYLVMHAELDGLIVSGPLRGSQHTYALVAERLAGRPVTRPDDPVAELWRRFVVGHGPTSVRDFARWSSLTLTTARSAAAGVADRLESVEVAGEELWTAPDTRSGDPAEAAEAAEAVRLVPLYDELTLSYPRLNFPTSPDHPHPPDDDLRWGAVIAGLTNVGLWRRTLIDGRRRSVRLATTLTRRSRPIGASASAPSWIGWQISSKQTPLERIGPDDQEARLVTMPRTGHTVLAEADSTAFGSLRRRPTSRKERYALGKSLRQKVPRSSLGRWEVRSDRPDPVELIQRSHEGRLDWLIPIRVARMVGSPYGFLRGSAVVMAEDVAKLPASGITPVICGDAHLGNFGFYASPEGELVIDLNDFDEAHPGSWEWDLRRLVASIWVAGRENGSSESQCGDSVASCVRAYRDELLYLADQPLLMRSYNRLDVERLRETATEKSLRAEIARSTKRARSRTSDRALPRFTREHAGVRQIVEEPPLITHVMRSEEESIGTALDDYLGTLASHWQRVVGGYTIVDVAHKVVGVGSVGLRAYVVLLEGSSPDDVLFLQLKQARRSVLAPYVHGESAWHAHQGQRVVEYQQALQTVSDPLLGWTTVGEHQYYVRQFRNMKGTIALDAIDAAALTDYAGIVGHLLAKGHARTSGASMIAGYFGRGDNLERAMCRFAAAYADQTEADHAAFVAAARAGRLPIEPGALDSRGSAFRP